MNHHYEAFVVVVVVVIVVVGNKQTNKQRVAGGKSKTELCCIVPWAVSMNSVIFICPIGSFLPRCRLHLFMVECRVTPHWIVGSLSLFVFRPVRGIPTVFSSCVTRSCTFSSVSTDATFEKGVGVAQHSRQWQRRKKLPQTQAANTHAHTCRENSTRKKGETKRAQQTHTHTHPRVYGR